MTIRRLTILVAALALAVPGVAAARGGTYTFDGGTPKQQAQVRVALQASSFDWGIVRERIVIHLGKGTDTYAKPGEIWIDTDLLSAGVFAWGPIQHEYAHQVDFLVLTDPQRRKLHRLLGGRAWSAHDGIAMFGRELGHGNYGGERFASTLAWAYWQVPENSLRPKSANDEAAAMEPGRFRQLLEHMLGVSNPAPPLLRVP